MLVRIATLTDKFAVKVEPFWPLRRLEGMLRARLREKEELGEGEDKEEDEEDEEGRGGSFRIRLVYRGRLLRDIDVSIGDAGLTEDCVLHCMVSKLPAVAQPAVVVPHDDARGFSALRTAGYSDDEIEVVRLTYFPRVVDFARNRPPLNPREDPNDRWSRLEEEWMLEQSRDPSSEFSRNASAYTRQLRQANPGGFRRGSSPTGAVREAGGLSAGFVAPQFAAVPPPVPQTPQERLESQIEALRRTYSDAQIEQQLQQRVSAMRTGGMVPASQVLASDRGGRGPGAVVAGQIDRDPPEQAPPQREGTWGQFCLGFVLGFLLGIIMVFWLFERNLPRRQKMGILLGMSVNLTLQFYGVESDSEAAKKKGNLRGNLFGGIQNQTAMSLQDGIDPSDRLIPVSALNAGKGGASGDKLEGELILG